MLLRIPVISIAYRKEAKGGAEERRVKRRAKERIEKEILHANQSQSTISMSSILTLNCRFWPVIGALQGQKGGGESKEWVKKRWEDDVVIVDQTQRKVQIEAADSERMEGVMGTGGGREEKIKCREINHLDGTGWPLCCSELWVKRDADTSENQQGVQYRVNYVVTHQGWDITG